MSRSAITIAVLAASLAAAAVAAPASALSPVRADEDYRAVIERVQGMVGDPHVQSLADRHGLDVLDVTWEDTGRFHDSSVGPNISDMTIQVQHCERPDACELSLMPVVRQPNFEDQTGDVDLDRFQVLVGNERGEALQAVSLRDVLGDLRRYLHDGSSWAGDRTSLLSPRDTHALVSAQAAFLPIPPGGQAEFNPVLFNYQSLPGDPAVLTLVATREGTSVTVIDNQRDGFAAGPTWGQRLFFNQDGERASFTGTRQSDHAAAPDDTATGERPDAGADAAGGLNMVLLVQVPLKQRYEARSFDDAAAGGETVAEAMAAAPEADVEAAVIGHGEAEGPFTELDGLEIERDERFPIRVTVQFDKATSNGQVAAADMEEIDAQIDRVYADADYVGSLVVDGPTGRTTEHDGPKIETADWWRGFARRLELSTGWSFGDVARLFGRLRS